MNLADACERKTFADGECIIKQVSLAYCVLLYIFFMLQGDKAEHFFLVESGKVTVTREDPVSIPLKLPFFIILFTIIE